MRQQFCVTVGDPANNSFSVLTFRLYNFLEDSSFTHQQVKVGSLSSLSFDVERTRAIIKIGDLNSCVYETEPWQKISFFKKLNFE